MKLQDQCCTRPQAEKLREFGISQDGYFLINLKGEILEMWSVDGIEDDFCAAFTVAELGQMLPNGYDTMRITGHTPHLYMWRGYDLDGKDFPSDKGYRTEAECRASMLIYLLENHFITAEDVNARLKQE